MRLVPLLSRLLSLVLLFAACQPQPRPYPTAPVAAHADAGYSPGWRLPWRSFEVPEDLERSAALAYGVRTVLDEADEAERDRVLTPYWGFGPVPLLCASEGNAMAPSPREAWQQEEIHLGALVVALEHEWKSEETALAVLFVGPEAISRAHKRIRKPAALITLDDLRRRLRRADRAKLELADEALRRANMFGMHWPVQRSYRVTSRFGMRVHPVTGTETPHRGIDVATPVGTEVRAAAAGIVRRVRQGGGNGLWVEVEHKGGVRTQYLHLSAFAVKRGQKVAAGEVIGYSGATGRVTGPHLHYQVVQPDGHLDPLSLRVARELAVSPLVRSSSGRDPRTHCVVSRYLQSALGFEASENDGCSMGRDTDAMPVMGASM